MNIKTKSILAVLLVTIGVLGRLLPHTWNFAPIVAIGIFSGAYLGKRFAFFVPVLAMVISDVFIGFYAWKLNLTVYLAMALSGALGLLLQSKKTPIRITLASFAGSTLFFVITNGAVWFFGHSYDPGVKGLIDSLLAGIPFFRNAIVGDVWYSYIFFGTFELSKFLANTWNTRKKKLMSSTFSNVD